MNALQGLLPTPFLRTHLPIGDASNNTRGSHLPQDLNEEQDASEKDVGLEGAYVAGELTAFSTFGVFSGIESRSL